jgi:ankyrin repeat protein
VFHAIDVGYEHGSAILHWDNALEYSTRRFRGQLSYFARDSRRPVTVSIGMRACYSVSFNGGAGGTPAKLKFAWLGLEVLEMPQWSEDYWFPRPSYRLEIPLWMLGLPLLPLPLWWVARQRKRWRRSRWEQDGHCGECGYDLRASKSRCPECGRSLAVGHAGASPLLGSWSVPIHALIVALLLGAGALCWEEAFAHQQDAVRAQSRPAESLARPVREAVKRRDLAGVRKLLDCGADPNEDGLLHEAAAQGNIPLARLLLDRGVDVDELLGGGLGGAERTPLLEATLCGRWEMVRLLLEHGADWRKIYWDQALITLLWHPKLQLARRIADPNARTERGISLVVLAAIWDEPDILGDLLRRGGLASSMDDEGDTALHIAAAGENSECIELLVAAGADINAKNRAGLTPLDVARRPELAAWLRQHGATESGKPHNGAVGIRGIVAAIDLRQCWPDNIDVIGRLLLRR